MPDTALRSQSPRPDGPYRRDLLWALCVSVSKMPSGATRSTLAATKFTNPVKFCIMAGTAVPRSHRGTGVSPMKDWAVQADSL